MDRRSYLDSLNAGRIRRPQTSLEQLNRSLEHLEKQLQMRSTPPQAAVDSYQQTRRRLGEEASYYRPGQEDFAAPPPRPADDYRDTRAAELSYGRTNPDQSRIADELEALRNELRARLDGAAAEAAQSPAAGIAQELEALRAEMRSQLSEARRELSAREQGTPRSDGSMAEATEIKAEIERLTDAVHSLAHRTDDRPMNVLRLELEQARAAIDSLAREDTVRTIGDRWDDFERRMESFQENMTADIRSRPADPGVDALTARIEQMNTALNNLPDSLPLRSLDDKMRKLSMAVEKFVQQQETRQPQSLAAVETRLDEISRAIVASAVSANAGAPDTEQMRRIETRIAQLSRQIEESAKAQPAPPAFDEAGILDAIDERFGELSRRMDAARASEDAILGLQQRLESIATKLEQPVAAAPSVDPSLVSNLEAQIAGLSRFLSKPDPRQDEMRILAPRLDSLEKSIVGNRDLMVEAAREAADRAVRSMAGAPRDDLELASGLAGDLKQLEGLTRRSDERNAKTFEAIHDTLLKIVDRLGTLEQGDRTAVAEAVRRPVDMPETPALDPADDDQFEDDHIDVAAERPRLTPAQAAAAAAEAALGEAPNAPERSRPKRSMLGGLFNRKNAPVQTQPALAGMQEPVVEDGGAPSIDIDEPLDPRAGNRPLEPGSGAPDLNAIMRRVRD